VLYGFGFVLVLKL